MQRKMLVSLAATACSLTGSGAAAMAVVSGSGGPTAAAPTAGSDASEPSVVIERLYDDTFVVLGSKPLAALRSTSRASTAPATEDAPSVTAPEGGPVRTGGAVPTTKPPSSTKAPPAVVSTTTVGAASVPIVPTTSRPPSTTAGSPTTTAAAAAQAATYTSAGGSFTLRWTSTAMQVASTAPNSGYQARTEGAGTEIHVLFTSSTRDIEITITLVGGSPQVKGLGNG